MNERKKVLRRIRNSAVIRNPLLFEAVGLCPVVAIATSLKAAAFLALLTALEMIICEVLASLLLKNVRRYLRVALYFIFGGAIIFPMMLVTQRFIPWVTVDFGVFLPLMAVNSLIALHCERVAVKATVKNSFIDAVFASLSYGVTAILVGFFRELLGSGAVGGLPLNMPVKFPALLLPFGGLLLLGFFSAALKAVIDRKYPDASPDRSFDTSELRRSLRGSLRELMNDDFNPYGDDRDIIPEGAVYIKKHKPKHTDKASFATADTIVIGDELSAAVNALQSSGETPEKEGGEKDKKRLRPKKEKKPRAKRFKGKNREKSDGAPAPADRSRELPDFDVQERTYLDDFSDMLSELEDYKKAHGSEEPDSSPDTDDNGGGAEE